jgi:DNA-binding XRE family transcriptional regulator
MGERAQIMWVTLYPKVIFSQLVLTMAATGHVSEALQAWREEQKAQVTQVLRNSVVGMSIGRRIRNLRTLLGWSQRQAAEHFGVSVRTVIRHEHGESFRPWWPLVEKVRVLEEANAEELIAYLVHAERSDAARSGRVDPPGELRGRPSGAAAIG